MRASRRSRRRVPVAPLPEVVAVKRRGVLKVASFLLGLLVALIAAEGLVRGLGLGPEVVAMAEGRYRLSANPTIGYEPVPKLSYDGESLHFYDYRGASNRLGYRDNDHPVAKPAGVYRVVVLGDSIAAGQTVASYADTFPAVLQELLNVRGLRAEVINFGVSGYSTEQEVETLVERGLAFDPDLVLVAYCLNDRGRCDGGILQTLAAKAGRGGVDPEQLVLRSSALARLLWYGALRRHEQWPAAFADRVEDTVEASFTRLAALAAAHRFAVMVAVFPDLRDLRRYGFASEHRWVAAQSARCGFHHLDLLAALQVGERDVGNDTYHPNELGHRVAGRAMASFILETVVGRQ